MAFVDKDFYHILYGHWYVTDGTVSNSDKVTAEELKLFFSPHAANNPKVVRAMTSEDKRIICRHFLKHAPKEVVDYARARNFADQQRCIIAARAQRKPVVVKEEASNLRLFISVPGVSVFQMTFHRKMRILNVMEAVSRKLSSSSTGRSIVKRMSFRGKNLDGMKTLVACGLENDDTLVVQVGLPGGKGHPDERPFVESKYPWVDIDPEEEPFPVATTPLLGFGGIGYMTTNFPTQFFYCKRVDLADGTHINVMVNDTVTWDEVRAYIEFRIGRSILVLEYYEDRPFGRRKRISMDDIVAKTTRVWEDSQRIGVFTRVRETWLLRGGSRSSSHDDTNPISRIDSALSQLQGVSSDFGDNSDDLRRPLPMDIDKLNHKKPLPTVGPNNERNRARHKRRADANSSSLLRTSFPEDGLPHNYPDNLGDDSGNRGGGGGDDPPPSGSENSRSGGGRPPKAKPQWRGWRDYHLHTKNQTDVDATGAMTEIYHEDLTNAKMRVRSKVQHNDQHDVNVNATTRHEARHQHDSYGDVVHHHYAPQLPGPDPLEPPPDYDDIVHWPILIRPSMPRWLLSTPVCMFPTLLNIYNPLRIIIPLPIKPMFDDFIFRTRSGFTSMCTVRISRPLFRKLEGFKRGAKVSKPLFDSIMNFASELPGVSRIPQVIVEDTVRLACQVVAYRRYLDGDYQPLDEGTFETHSLTPYFWLASPVMVGSASILTYIVMKNVRSTRNTQIMDSFKQKTAGLLIPYSGVSARLGGAVASALSSMPVLCTHTSFTMTQMQTFVKDFYDSLIKEIMKIFSPLWQNCRSLLILFEDVRRNCIFGPPILNSDRVYFQTNFGNLSI